MIDALSETLIPLSRVSALLPVSARSGRRFHVETVRRWATEGCRGVVLETLRLPAGRYTSPAAITRFLQELNAREEIPA